jgi:glycerate 2-kinase
VPPIRLADKIRTTEILLACGADIRELNTIRKHLSRIKGGGLQRRLACPSVTLAISDVVGDDPSLIGSGPTVADLSTFADAWAICTRYGLEGRLPARVVQVLQEGCRGERPETLKPEDAVAALSTFHLIASNASALAAAALRAQSLGLEVIVEKQPLSGDTRVAARDFAARLRELASTAAAPLCILAGGETTVTVLGGGRGGRNQEFALALAEEVDGRDMTILSAGTDGIDGPTDATGAFVDGNTLARARSRGLSANASLHANDSYSFFSVLGDLLRIGPTGTNVMDIKIALVGCDSGKLT